MEGGGEWLTAGFCSARQRGGEKGPLGFQVVDSLIPLPFLAFFLMDL